MITALVAIVVTRLDCRILDNPCVVSDAGVDTCQCCEVSPLCTCKYMHVLLAGKGGVEVVYCCPPYLAVFMFHNEPLR